MSKGWHRDLDLTWRKVAPSSRTPSRNHSSSGVGRASPRLRQVTFAGTPATRDTEGPPSTWGGSGGTVGWIWGQSWILGPETLIFPALTDHSSALPRLSYSQLALVVPCAPQGQVGWVLTQHVQLGSSRAEACLCSLTFVGCLIL